MIRFDVVAIGSCYVDINTADYPLNSSGIPNETELIGGEYEIVPGGSAVNFCRLIAAIGMRPAFIGVAGMDSMGDLLEVLLAKDNVEPILIRKRDAQTNIGFNMTSAEGGHIMCVAGTANATLSSEDAMRMLRDAAKDSRAIYLGGCFKLKTFSSSFQSAVEVAKQNTAALFVDHGRVPADVDPTMVSHVQELVLRADYYMASKEEFIQLWGVNGVDEGLMQLYYRSPELTVVVKDGENGAYYSEHGGVRHVLATKVTKISNLTGAGDSFNAGFIAAISADKKMSDAVSYGCRVAAAKISGQTIPKL